MHALALVVGFQDLIEGSYHLMMISKDTQDMSSAQRTAGVTKKVLGVEMIVVLSQLLMSAK